MRRALSVAPRLLRHAVPGRGALSTQHHGYSSPGMVTGVPEEHDTRFVFGAAASLAAAAAVVAFHAQARDARLNVTSCTDLKVYKRDEVSTHTTKETGIWVTYKDGVYDITNFIINHPGGDKIMLAAGKAIDPFWRVYQQHENRGNASKLLEDMLIGKLDPDDVVQVLGGDPYDEDPERHPGLLFHNNKPCNAELPIELMLDSWITPNALWFIRHHHPVPHIDHKEYRLNIGGLGTKSILLDLEDLKSHFEAHEVTTTVQCGGNRRADMNTVHETSGIAWGVGAISCACFKGVYLRDILTYSGLMTPGTAAQNGVQHVVFHGYDGMQASIPIEKALSPYGDVLLAYEMNGEPLPPEHGAPLRLVVPGHVGVRNVKWVSKIVTSTEEAEGTWQRGIAYKGFSPMVRSLSQWDAQAVEALTSVQEQPVTSVIVTPKEGYVEEFDDVTVTGYAWSGGGRGIVRVDVSADAGKTWTTAELKEGSEQHKSRAWAWTFWEAEVPLPAGAKPGDRLEVVCKATDAAYNCQPEFVESIWNLRGLNNNAWHRVHISRE